METPAQPATLAVTTLAKRPDLLPVVAEWLWRQWWHGWGRTLDETVAIYAECVAELGAPQTFVLLADGQPVGTATLARKDLEERPQLTPWLAGVFVVPQARGRGYVTHLLAAFEAACRRAAIPEAWLYTTAAERVYLRAGWHRVEIIERTGKLPATLMRKAFPAPG